jgi:Rod binding domain-containing protein
MALPLAPVAGQLALSATANVAVPAVGKLAGKAAGSVASLLASLAGTPEGQKLKKTADDFESMFLEQMVDRMTQTGGAEGPLGENGTGGEIWRSMLSSQYAKTIARSGGVGISDQIMRAMIQMQAGSGNGG